MAENDALATALEALDAKATPLKWEGHHGHDDTGYPCYFLHGFSGGEKSDTARHDANLALVLALRNHLPELLAALRASRGPQEATAQATQEKVREWAESRSGVVSDYNDDAADGYRNAARTVLSMLPAPPVAASGAEVRAKISGTR